MGLGANRPTGIRGAQHGRQMAGTWRGDRRRLGGRPSQRPQQPDPPFSRRSATIGVVDRRETWPGSDSGCRPHTLGHATDSLDAPARSATARPGHPGSAGPTRRDHQDVGASTPQRAARPGRTPRRGLTRRPRHSRAADPRCCPPHEARRGRLPPIGGVPVGRRREGRRAGGPHLEQDTPVFARLGPQPYADRSRRPPTSPPRPDPGDQSAPRAPRPGPGPAGGRQRRTRTLPRRRRSVTASRPRRPRAPRPKRAARCAGAACGPG